MSFQSIKLLPIFLVLGLITTLGACTTSEEVTSPDDNITEDGLVEPESPAETTEAE